MDWVLPDPSRHISGRHFVIGFEKGGYTISDVSTNGTFVLGERHRIDGKRPIRSGDRFTVGHYIVAATIESAARDVGRTASEVQGRSLLQTPPHMQQRVADDDPWSSLGGGAVEPVDPLPKPAKGRRGLDDLDDFLPLGGPAVTPPPGQGERHMPPPVDRPIPQQMPPLDRPGPPPAVSAPTPAPGSGGWNQPPAHVPRESGAWTGHDGDHAPPGPSHPPLSRQDAPGERFVTVFLEAAGLSGWAVPPGAEEALARELGRCVRVATDEIMVLLKDRDAQKKFTRGGDRTMHAATGNNPLKMFRPDGDQALDAMFVRPRDGFMTGAPAFENALRDLRQHQFAVFAAIQPALAEVLDGLTPDEILGDSNSLLGGRKSRAWETYVQRYDQKSGENGLLDLFLEAFARAYGEALHRASD